MVAQQFIVETVRNPTSNVSVATYNGWANSASSATFAGTAIVQNLEPSTTLAASGSGNVWFNAVPGNWFEITLKYWPACNGYPAVNFLLHNYDTANPANQLILESSTDNGSTYQQLPYHRLGMHLFQSGFWNVMESSSQQPVPCNATSYKVRFRQTSSSRSFRIDDIRIEFGFLLPLRLSGFSVSSQGTTNNVRWIANTTEASSSFYLQQSFDGVRFNTIDVQSGKSIGTFSYEYADVQTSAQRNVYYRLQYVSNGKISCSPVLLVRKEKEDKMLQAVFPVPAKEHVSLTINSSANEKAIATLLDFAGRVVLVKELNVAKGSNTFLVQLPALSPGKYLLSVAVNNFEETKVIIIQ